MSQKDKRHELCKFANGTHLSITKFCGILTFAVCTHSLKRPIVYWIIGLKLNMNKIELREIPSLLLLHDHKNK